MYLTKKKLKNVLSKGYDLNTFISDRAGRKSSVVQEFFIDEAKAGRPFILIRSKTDEAITENWLSDYVSGQAAIKGYRFFSKMITRNIQAIYFIDKQDKEYLYCYGLWLSIAEKYKSNYFKGFEKVKYILWEECIPNYSIAQDVKFIIKKHMDKFISLLSIGSTIARKNKIQYILLGNDISVNLINPVTVAFDLLERLDANCEIVDRCKINDCDYTFYFNYFDFPGAVNHWLENKEFDISKSVKILNPYKYDVILLSAFKKYYIYRAEGFLYVTPEIYKANNRSTLHFINSEIEFFEQYGAGQLLDKFNRHLALTMLQTLYNVSDKEIAQYYGPSWYLDSGATFNPNNQTSPERIINLSELVNMELSNVVQLDNFCMIRALNELIKENVVIYENVKIKILFEQLRLMLLYL